MQPRTSWRIKTKKKGRYERGHNHRLLSYLRGSNVCNDRYWDDFRSAKSPILMLCFLNRKRKGNNQSRMKNEYVRGKKFSETSIGLIIYDHLFTKPIKPALTTYIHGRGVIPSLKTTIQRKILQGVNPCFPAWKNKISSSIPIQLYQPTATSFNHLHATSRGHTKLRKDKNGWSQERSIRVVGLCLGYRG